MAFQGSHQLEKDFIFQLRFYLLHLGPVVVNTNGELGQVFFVMELELAEITE